ncbi:MAG TPA: hypothetical protein VGN49_08645 [Micrococcaceae bacterium]|jgi:hypothetical protein|nr:hypothetical protein [Micrococcaceae bacterium]
MSPLPPVPGFGGGLIDGGFGSGGAGGFGTGMTGTGMTGTSMSGSGPPGFTIRGGAGSIRYVLTEIVAASTDLQRIAEQLGAMSRGVEDALIFMDAASFGVYSYPVHALDQLRSASRGCRDCHSAVQEIAAEAATAADRYRQAEEDNSRFLAAQKSSTAYSGGLQLHLASPLAAPVFALWQLATVVEEARARGLRDAAEDLVNNAPEFLAGAAGLPYGLASMLTRQRGQGGLASGPFGENAAVGLRRFLAGTGAFLPGELQVARLQPAAWNPAQLAGQTVLGDGSVLGSMDPTLHGLFAGSKDAYTVAPSALVVKRIERGADGPAWIVDLPGTEVWNPLDSSNPWDLEGDLEGITSSRRADLSRQVMVEEWVKTALRDAGALADQPVMINGHSGGGIQAAAMAADPAFLAEVNVRIINIAGAPAANQDVVPGIKVLDLQNTDDVVPAADLAKPPDTADWVTATSGHRMEEGTKGNDDGNGTARGNILGQAHSLDGYLRDASQLDQSADISILAHKQAVLGFLGAAALTGTVRYRKYVYQGTDRNRASKVTAGQNVPGR